MNKIQEKAKEGLDELKIMDAEREFIIETAKKYDENSFPNELRVQMQEHLEKYKKWNRLMQNLRVQSDTIKKEIGV